MLAGKYCQSIDIQLEPFVFRVGLLPSCTCMLAWKYCQSIDNMYVNKE